MSKTKQCGQLAVYQSWANFRSEEVRHEDGNRHEEHATNRHDTEQVTIVIGRLIVFSAKGKIVIAEQRDANDAQQLERIKCKKNVRFI